MAKPQDQKTEGHYVLVTRLVLSIQIMMVIVTTILILVLAIYLLNALVHWWKKNGGPWSVNNSMRRHEIHGRAATRSNINTSMLSNWPFQRRMTIAVSFSDVSNEADVDFGMRDNNSLQVSHSTTRSVMPNTRLANRLSSSSSNDWDEENPPSYEEAIKLQNKYKPVTYLAKGSCSCKQTQPDPSDALTHTNNEFQSMSVTPLPSPTSVIFPAEQS